MAGLTRAAAPAGASRAADPADVREEFRGLISLLGFFAASGRFSVVDRIGFAQSPESVRESIYEALRVVRALEQRPAVLRLRVKGREGGEAVVECECIDYERGVPENACRGVYGRVVEARGAALEAGEEVCCYTRPLIPSEEELSKLFKALDEDPTRGLSLARQIASLAMAWRPSGPAGCRVVG